jgi:outer membrane protein
MLQKYRTDSLNLFYSSLAEEYTYKDSILTKTDTSKTPKSVLNQLKNDVSSLIYQLQNWSSISQQAYQAKQQTLYYPLINKMNAAIKQVAKEKNYTYILTSDVFLVAPDGDDILPLVAAKLGIKLPAFNKKN